jgi:sigma-B regulation protein RsbU (phosphoserine phosphatase)
VLKKIRRLRPPRPPRMDRGVSRRSADRMKLVLDISRLLTITDLPTLLVRIAEAAASFLDAERARVFLHDPVTNELWTARDASGVQVRVPCDQGIPGHVFRTGQMAEAPDLGTGPAGAGEPSRSVLCAPLRDLDRQTIGVVEVTDKKTGRFTPEDRVAIELLAEHAALAIQRFRLILAASQGSELRKEMELAHRVQTALAPAHPPRVSGLDAVGWSRAASVTGGDCYDLWTLPSGMLAAFVADASGHGLAAALVISQVRAVLRALSDIESDPQWLLERLNARLAADLHDGRFVTAFIAVFAADGWVHWSSAGQGPLFFRAGGGGRFETLPAPAVPLGVSADFISDKPTPVRLDRGGMLVVMTDGLFEAANPAGEFFGAGRAAEILDSAGGSSAEALVARLRDAVRAWQEHDEPADDQTILVVRRVE